MKRISLLKSMIIVIVVFFSFSSCKKDEDNNIGEVIVNNPEYMPGKGVFIINEGTFQAGNGSIDFINMDLKKNYYDVFFNVNDVALGDIPMDFRIYDTKGYLVVNNSGKVEIVNMSNFKSIATIDGLNQPRRFLKVSDNKAYVSSLAEAFLYVIDLSTNTISGNISTQKSCENLLEFNDFVYTTNWSNWYVMEENNTVQIIDINTDQKVKDIVVTKEPNSMVIDKNNVIWVLCSGGFMGDEIPALCKIDPLSQQLIETIAFADTNMNPSKLCINGNGDQLFFLNNGIFKMDITSSNIPQQALIAQTTIFFYGLFVDPETTTIYTSDAGDFQSKGKIIQYDQDGNYLSEVVGGIVPGEFTFIP